VTCWGTIVAAGAGRRFGGHLPKVYVDLAGRPILVRTLEAVQRCPAMDGLVLVVEPTHMRRQREPGGRLVVQHQRRKELRSGVAGMLACTSAIEREAHVP